MQTASLQAASDLSLPPDSYVYSIVFCSAAQDVAAIASDDSLRIVDASRLQGPATYSNIHAGVTCLRQFPVQPNILLTAGRDAAIRGWDIRSGERVVELIDPSHAPVLSLATSGQHIVGGIELQNSQAPVTLWDVRSTDKPVLQYIESHNDDVTELHFHPKNPTLLLSGSTDGLINIFDTSIPEEEDALVQITNHGSSIHHANFLDPVTFYGLSHDENFSVYPMIISSNEEEGEAGDRESHHIGDLRPLLECDYVVDVFEHEGINLLAAGSHSSPDITIFPLFLQGDSYYAPSTTQGLRLLGGHGDDVVRAICSNDNGMVYTGGEDGRVRAWRVGS